MKDTSTWEALKTCAVASRLICTELVAIDLFARCCLPGMCVMHAIIIQLAVHSKRRTMCCLMNRKAPLVRRREYRTNMATERYDQRPLSLTGCTSPPEVPNTFHLSKPRGEVPSP